MAEAARKMEDEIARGMADEARLVRLESDVGHIRSSVSGLQTDLREFRKEVQGDHVEMRREHRTDIVRLDGKIDAIGASLNGKSDELAKAIGGVEESLRSAKVAGLVLAGSMVGFLLVTGGAAFGLLSNRIDKLSEEVGRVSNDVAALTVNMANLTLKVDALADNQAQMSGKISAMAERITAIEAAVVNKK